MPDRESVSPRINIAVVSGTTLTAHPFPYSQTCDTFWPRFVQATATRKGLGGLKIGGHCVFEPHPYLAFAYSAQTIHQEQ